MKTIFVTGASGFIGQNICRDLVATGYNVIGICRTAPRVRGVAHYAVHLGESISQLLERHRPFAVIHCANSSTTNQWVENIAGTVKWEEEIRLSNDCIQIFLGSASGHSSSSTLYGKSKFELEHYFYSHGHWVLKLGLVVGKGGLMLKLAQLTLNNRILPLIGGGVDRVYWTDLYWVQLTITKILSATILSENKQISLISEEPTNMRALLNVVAKTLSRKPLLLPISTALLYYPIRLLEALGVKLPIQSSSIIAASENAKITWTSDVPSIIPFANSINTVVSEHFNEHFLEFLLIHSILFPKKPSFSEELYRDYVSAVLTFKNAKGTLNSKEIDFKILIALNTDIESVEFSLRRAGINSLTQRFQVLSFLCEARSEYFAYFINEENNTLGTFFLMANETIRSIFKLIKGNIIRNRYGI